MAHDVAVGFKPAERLPHGLGLNTYQLGQLRLRHGAVVVEHFDGDDSGMGQANSTQLFIPGVFNEACRSGQEAPGGPAIHIRHTNKYSQVLIRPRAAEPY